MKNLLFILVFLLFNIKSNSQNLQLLVKKGSVIVSGKIIKPGKIEQLSINDDVKLLNTSLALLLRNNKIVELNSDKEYNYNDLLKLFNPIQEFSSAFVNVILKQNYSNKKQSLLTTRGSNTNNNLWNYSPADSVNILTDSIIFSTGGITSKLISNITLIDIQKKDSIKLPSNATNYKLKTPLKGEYYWIYSLQNENQIKKFKNYFKVPNEEEKNKLLIDFNNYKKTITQFSLEMQDYLIKEYLSYNKIYIQ